MSDKLSKVRLLVCIAVMIISGLLVFNLTNDKLTHTCKKTGSQLSQAEIIEGFNLAAMEVVNTKYLMAERLRGPNSLENLVFYQSVEEFKRLNKTRDVDFINVIEADQKQRKHILTIYPGAAYLDFRRVRVANDQEQKTDEFVDYRLAIDACGDLISAQDGL